MMKTWFFAAIASLLLLAGCGGGHLAQLNSRPAPSWPENDATPSEGWEQQSKFDVPVQVNKQVKAYLVYFSTKRHEVIQRQLARSTRYLPMIREVFEEYGLPEDLAYLAMIESGFNPEAQSPAGARGMWQFIKGTGLRYGLVIDGYTDERRDPVKSTRAAARYLLDLYRQFGSWYLAAASYNCGEKRVQKELHKGNRENFWELSADKCLPSETENYVPQMIAATIIAKNPEKFGFKDVPYQPPDTNLAVAALPDEPPAGGKGNLRPAVSPVPSPPIRTAAYSPGRRPSDYAAPSRSRQPDPNPDHRILLAKKPPPPAVSARSGNADTRNLVNGNSAPYAASMFGSIVPPKKDLARENRSKAQTIARKRKTMDRKVKVVDHKSKKPAHALLAMTREPKNGKAKTLKRNTAGLTRTKPKTFQVSEAR